MKRFALVALVVMACGFSVYGQQFAVQVLPFEAKNGVSAGDAAAVTELLTAELIKTGKLQVASPSNYQVRGTMTQFAGELVITVKMIDWNTQIVSSTFSRMDSMGQVLGRLPSIAKSLVDQLSSDKNAIRQQYIVKLNPFDLKGEMSAGDLEGITEFITYSLVNSGIKVAWGNENEKVNASLRGSVVSLAGQTVITASIVDNSTNQPVSTATLQLGNIGEIYDSKDKSKTSSKWNSFTTALYNVPMPSGYTPFVGRWQGEVTFTRDYWTNHDNHPKLTCILNIQADGTIIIERYDTATYTLRETTRVFSDDEYTATWGSPNRNGRGSGTYRIIENGKSTIRATFNVNVSGTVGPGNYSRSITASIGLNKTHVMEMPGDSDTLQAIYMTRFENGKERARNWRGNSVGGGYRYFTRLN
jgi:hypothetical protein